MLSFHSGQSSATDIDLGVAQCMRAAFPDDDFGDCHLVIVHTTMTNDFLRIADDIHRYVPGAVVVGNSCDGVISREGPQDSIRELALMAVSGPPSEFAVKTVSGIYNYNSSEKAGELAWALRGAVPEATSAYLLCQGADLSHDRIVDAFTDVFGDNLHIMGGTVGGRTCCFCDFGPEGVMIGEHIAWVVGFADPTVKCATQWLHNSAPYGDPLVVSAADKNKILEFNGKPAWQEFTARLQVEAKHRMHSPITILAEELSANLACRHGQSHILHAIAKVDADDGLYLPIDCPIGMYLWPATHQFGTIFSTFRESLSELCHREPLAVFQGDSLMQTGGFVRDSVGAGVTALLHKTFAADDNLPPWLGMRCFGAFAKVGEQNCFHNHSICVAVLYRQVGGHVISRRRYLKASGN